MCNQNNNNINKKKRKTFSNHFGALRLIAWLDRPVVTQSGSPVSFVDTHIGSSIKKVEQVAQPSSETERK